MSEFYDKVDKMFENKLFYEEISLIRVKNIKENKILEDLPYEEKLRFDSNLNIYKLQNDGYWSLVNDVNFKAIIVSKEKYKTNG